MKATELKKHIDDYTTTLDKVVREYCNNHKEESKDVYEVWFQVKTTLKEDVHPYKLDNEELLNIIKNHTNCINVCKYYNDYDEYYEDRNEFGNLMTLDEFCKIKRWIK